MPNKTKIGVVLVAVIALFSVYGLSKFMHNLANGGPSLANIFSNTTDTQNCPGCDPDHDGLTNAEEILWTADPFKSDSDSDGFKDGEEVASGHNPLVPGPDDLINSDNLTDQLSNLTVAGLAAGALNPASESYSQTLADITSSVADSGKYLFNKKVSEDSLTVISGNTNTNAAYVQSSIPIVKSFAENLSSQLGTIPEDVSSIGKDGFTEKLKKDFQKESAAYDGISRELSSLAVPKPFAESHASLLSMVQQMRDASNGIANGDKDVITAVFALDATGNVPDKLVAYMNSYLDVADREHITGSGDFGAVFSEIAASMSGLVGQTAQASVVGDTVAKFTGCAAGSWLGNYIDNQLNKLKGRIQKMKDGWLKDTLSLIFGALGDSGSVPVADEILISAWNNKYSRDDIIARCLARAIINNITNNTNTVIKTRGRDGGSALVTNWRAFLTQAQYRGENVFRAMLSTANLCDYFGSDLKKTYGLKPTDRISLAGANTRVGDILPFSVRVNCTLPKGFTLEKYREDFGAMGGWDLYAQLTQPQNNLYGATTLAQNEINRQRSITQEEDTTQVLANNGYTGISGNGKNDSCSVKGWGGACIIYKNIKTSGQYLAASTAAGITAEYAWLTTSQGLGTLIEDITQNMIYRLFDQTDTSDVALAGEPPEIPIGTSTPRPSVTPPGGGQTCEDSCYNANQACQIGCNGAYDREACIQNCEDAALACFNSCIEIPAQTYSCNQAGQCVYDPNGTYTDSSCNNACQPTPTCDPNDASCNPPGPTPAGIDLSQASILGGPSDVASWPETAKITSVAIPANANISIDFTKKNPATGWFCQLFDGSARSYNPDECAQYTVWLFEYINGQWYGAGSVVMWDTRDGTGPAPSGYSIYRQLKDNWVYRWPPMSTHTLRRGEQVGFMVTPGNARSPIGTVIRERSDVFLVNLP